MNKESELLLESTETVVWDSLDRSCELTLVEAHGPQPTCHGKDREDGEEWMDRAINNLISVSPPSLSEILLMLLIDWTHLEARGNRALGKSIQGSLLGTEQRGVGHK